jgi:hypothetical protein
MTFPDLVGNRHESAQGPGRRKMRGVVRGCLAPLLDIASSDLMGGNAARFLGLTDPKSGTRKRLDAFRGDTFLARWET